VRCVIPAEAGIQAALCLLLVCLLGKRERWDTFLDSRFRGKDKNPLSPANLSVSRLLALREEAECFIRLTCYKCNTLAD